MLEVEFTQRAEKDLTEIYEHTVQTFGEAKAAVYCADLAETISLLAQQPKMGREVSIRPGVHRHEHRKHTIFYKIDSDAIVIGRILHSASEWRKYL